MRLLFAAHGECHTTLWIPRACLLHNVSAVLEHLCLTLDLIVDRIFQRFEGVDVFHLRPYTELI